ncbi:ferritin-like protein [Cooperia oncophora]
MESQIRMNYAKELEAAVNKQVNIELYASYVYLSMSMYFDRDDVALPKISKFFRKQSDEEREHAFKIMKMQNLRGGRVVLQAVNKPEKDEFFRKQSDEEREHAFKIMKMQNLRGGRVVLQAVNKPEKDERLLDLHAVATSCNDPQFTDFLESEMLEEQAALALEKFNNQALLDLHAVATSCNDPQFTDFLESEMLEEQA